MALSTWATVSFSRRALLHGVVSWLVAMVWMEHRIQDPSSPRFNLKEQHYSYNKTKATMPSVSITATNQLKTKCGTNVQMYSYM